MIKFSNKLDSIARFIASIHVFMIFNYIMLLFEYDNRLGFLIAGGVFIIIAIIDLIFIYMYFKSKFNKNK